MVPDYGKSQHKNPSHSKTRLPDYHDSAANVTNQRFILCHSQRTCSHFQTKTPCHFVTQSIKITSRVCTFNCKNRKLVYILLPEVLLCCGYFSIWTVVYLALSTNNTEFVTLAVSTMNLVHREFLLCVWLSFEPSALLFRLGW